MFGSFSTDDLSAPLERLAGLALWVAKLTLLGALALSCASLFWLVVAGPGQDVRVSRKTTANTNASSVALNPDLFRQMDIFRSNQRESSQEVAPVVVDAPTTNLKIVLHGVRLSGDGNSTATISNEKDEQRTYQVGEEIDGLSGVKIDRIYSDGVLIVRNGKVERLLIRDPAERVLKSVDAATGDRSPDVASTPASKSGSTVKTATQTAEKPQRFAVALASSDMLRLFQSMSFDATGLEEGVYVFPTRNAALFARSGLKARDIVTGIGGFKIGAATDFNKLLIDIQDEKTTDVEILRDGRPVLISLRRTD